MSSETEAGAHPRPRLWPLALTSALLMTAAFPPVDAGFLAWLGLVPLFRALERSARPGKAFGIGYLFGVVHWGWTITWIGATVTNWADTPLGWIAWAGLTLIKALWFGLFGLTAWWIARKASGGVRALGYAAAWTVIEWLRGQSLVAMPWSLVGYTQYRYLPLIQAADLGGVYLITFVVVWFNAALCGAAGAMRRKADSGLREWVRAARRGVLAPGLMAALLALYGFIRLQNTFDGQKLRVAVIQPNLETIGAAAPNPTEELRRFARLAEAASKERPQLIVWPESTVDDLSDDPAGRAAFGEMARRAGARVVVGAGYTDEQGRPLNSAALFEPSGRMTARYDKYWLVPFGEWIPARAWLPFGDVFKFRERDLHPGPAESLLSAGDARMAVLICYESVFPILSRMRARLGANLLVSITNDSWAGKSAELQQHHAMTLFRAVENRRWLASSATTGITCLIDPAGRVQRVPPYREGFAVGDAVLLDGTTLYAAAGDWVVLLSALGLVWLCAAPRCD